MKGGTKRLHDIPAPPKPRRGHSEGGGGREPPPPAVAPFTA
eukprot:CAMPEP_0119090092 /NCGR_PEP_ID=MMETSP1178-20130426/151333_1 /TAXON_ID=33656 /ORGANISM="unid sp, Strain CCMP2000" /LENGTH=40 /DNA_ID= /DNA_START= /DNA_END= /DNA_ORIENTATION=